MEQWNRAWRDWLRKESRVLFSLSWPVCLSFFFQQMIPLTALLFLGHVSKSRSKLLIDAAALGSSCVALAGFTVFIGLSSATETLCSQAYGAGNYRRVGVILQRSILICYLALFIVASLLLNAESILLILDQPPCVARLAAVYCRYSIIRLVILCVELVIIRYLQAQGVIKPLVGAALFGNVVNLATLSMLLLIAKMEIQGAVLSIVMGMFTLTTSLILYVKVRGIHKKTWKGWSWECLEQWGQFLWLAIPGIVTIAAEISNFETGAFVTGSIDGTQQAAYVIMFNVAIISYMVPLSISIAVGIRVGNVLGAGEPDKAKKAMMVAISFALLWSFVVAIIMLSYRRIGELFTSDREVIKLVGQLTYLMAIFLIVDTIQGVLGGVLRGCGKQLATAITNVISFHIVGLPISLTLVYAADMGAQGFWLGSTVGSITQLTLEIILVVKMDWKLQSCKARTNAGVSKSCDIKELDDVPTSAHDQGSHDECNQDDQGDSEEVVLLMDEDHDEDVTGGVLEDCGMEERSSNRRKSAIKLLLIRTPWFIIGLLILVMAVVLSQYHVHLPYQQTAANCDGVFNDTIDEMNFTNSSIL